MWPFRRKADDDESSYESYSSYEEFTDEEYEEEHGDEHDQGDKAEEVSNKEEEAIQEEHEEAYVSASEESLQQVVEATGTNDGNAENGESTNSTDETGTKEETAEEAAADSEPEGRAVAAESVEDAVPVTEPTPDGEPGQNEPKEEAAPNEPPAPETVVREDEIDGEEESVQSLQQDSGDEDLVMIKSQESSKGVAGLSSYDTEEELELMEVEDSFDTHEKSEYETGGEESEYEETSDEEEDEGPSSLAEKQSLLALAAEHDRVDILKAILAENASDQKLLLSLPIPPLHVAVSYGSTHATSCLLRMGANPAIRPKVSEVKSSDLHNLARYDGVSAWELAFGRETPLEESADELADKGEMQKDKGKEPQEEKKGWFWSKSSKTSEEKNDNKKEDVLPPPAASTRRIVKPVEMQPSKREGIRHAFTAEALRCIGADEADRLQQLLDSGMPSDIPVGGKTLHGWCLEMGAASCEPLIRPEHFEEEKEEAVEDEDVEGKAPESVPAQEVETEKAVTAMEPTEMAPTDGKESLASLSNRLEELEALATALATVLDNLAEEVSVCHGLLLSGGGAAALASHVRSLKTLREQREDELDHWTREWENGEDELAYWVREYGTSNYNDDFPAWSLATISRRNSFQEPQNAQEEESQRRQLLAQLGASENKVRKLRASITDLSEENTRDLEEVERRSLTGGVKLVRTLREELREVEFKLSEAKSGEAACRARVSLIQSRLDAQKKKAKGETNEGKQSPNESSGETEEQTDSASEAEPESLQTSRELPSESPQKRSAPDKGAAKSQSEAIATGDSTALTVHQLHGRGFLPVQLWDLLLRIVGMGKEAVRRSAENMRGSATNVMIV